MDAGKFNNLNFGNVGPNRFKPQGPIKSQEAVPGDQKNPVDAVSFGGFTPLQLNSPETVAPAEQTYDSGLIAGTNNVSRTEPTFSLSGPLGVNAVGVVPSFSNVTSGLTALNGINSTSLSSVNGVTVASVSPFNPASPTRMPTTSVSTFGIEDTQFITSSGRVISAEDRVSVRMPTTSVTTFGLEDQTWSTTSGRTITL